MKTKPYITKLQPTSINNFANPLTIGNILLGRGGGWSIAP